MRSSFVALLWLLLLSLPTLAQSAGDAVADFGFDYFSQIAKNDNTVVSPLSIHACFAMLTLGTSGPTRTETLKVLRLRQDFSRSYEHLLKGIRFAEQVPAGEQLPAKVHLASRIWPSRNLELKGSFEHLSKEIFGAPPESLNFGDPKEARRRINEWVSQQTEKLIPELLPAGGLNSGTELVLTNALYFKASWQSGFDPKNTRPSTFHTLGGQIETPMMSGQVDALFLESQDMKAVSLPYKGGPFAMLLVAPKTDLAECRSKLSKRLLGEVEKTSLGGIGKVGVRMPRFTISQESDPLPVLRSMGMEKLLGDSADFSELVENPGGLVVDRCFHQAVVELDETGTKAAAATAVGMVRSPMPSIVLDRPFLFVLYHRSTLAPLFIGQVVNPTK